MIGLRIQLSPKVIHKNVFIRLLVNMSNTSQQ